MLLLLLLFFRRASWETSLAPRWEESEIGQLGNRERERRATRKPSGLYRSCGTRSPPTYPLSSFHVLLSSRRRDAIFPLARPQTSGGWCCEVALGGWEEEKDRNGAVAPAVTKMKERKKNANKQNKKTSHAMIAHTHTHTKLFRHFRTSLFFISLSLSNYRPLFQ